MVIKILYTCVVAVGVGNVMETGLDACVGLTSGLSSSMEGSDGVEGDLRGKGE